MISNVAKRVFDKMTGDELHAIKEHFGAAYSEAKIVAILASKMLCRIAGVNEYEGVSSRALENIDILLDGAVERGLTLV